MCLEGRPYVVPLNFGCLWEGDTPVLYFHGALEGRKIDVLHQNPEVCVEMDTGHHLVEGATAAKYGFAYRSIIGFGTAEFLTATSDKEQGLIALMAQQTGRAEGWDFPSEALVKTAVFRVRLREFTGKARPLPGGVS
jgi:nitroimidazol reductase NimA-like FMN-containing flavoprotein (pyridoxamine 5'-phosphate oxidase superfamily)